MLRLLQTFGDQVRSDVRDIDQAISERNMPRVLELAHSLKGTSANVSADAVCQAATDLERSARAGRNASVESSLAQLKSEADRFLDFIEHSLAKQ
jgi:HPt (histidine-containing phosphotransfer) domain-containing protein